MHLLKFPSDIGETFVLKIKELINLLQVSSEYEHQAKSTPRL